MLTQERLKELLHYYPEAGYFTNKVWRGGKARAGSVAGSKNINGYMYMYVDSVNYRAHRLVWFYMYGEWPSDSIDHINGRRDDNRIKNLRCVTGCENNRNKSKYANNTSGVVGVGWHKASGKWAARIKIDCRRVNLGLFDNIYDAKEARRKAEIKYGFHENHGRDGL